MEITSIFFVIASLFVIVYFFYVFKSSKRTHILVEIGFIGIYLIILLITIFPNLLGLIEKTFGINSALNFIVYLSVFVAYFIIFLLYKKSEEQRVEITKLVREIAYLKNAKKK